MKQAYIIRSVIYILLQSIVYGFGNPLTKTAYESITPFWCLFFRFFLAFLIFMLFFGKSIIKQLKSAKILDILPASLCMAFAYICCKICLKPPAASDPGDCRIDSFMHAGRKPLIQQRRSFRFDDCFLYRRLAGIWQEIPGHPSGSYHDLSDSGRLHRLIQPYLRAGI